MHEIREVDDDVALAAVSIAELRTGVELASGSRRVARAAFVAVAQVHGRLLATAHREGTQRGAHDLIIAATAAA